MVAQKNLLDESGGREPSPFLARKAVTQEWFPFLIDSKEKVDHSS